MKKTLIMGATSLVLAATPVFGVFAATGDPAAVTDNLKVTVEEICTFTRTTGEGTYEKTMQANKLDTQFGTTTFKAVCNGDDGYSVAAVFTALAGSVSGSIAYSATTPTAGSGTWTATLGAYTATTNMAASGAKLIDKSTADDVNGTSQQVSYKVSTQATIAQGTYSGTATYTLTQK